ncbi:LCCL domain-containing protein [Actinomadura sp. 1N219]|uniref:protein kinase domain-containing protein n=1 Tax=Actinomadura sp. 1N219 TaxID=3375152 RepID=UPI0037B042FA
MINPGLVLAGRYRLVQPLGAGGFGEVWRGLDERLEREVAVKVLLGAGEEDGQAARLFEREAKVGAKLTHPGITVVHDVGVDSSCRFVVMELLTGRNLAAELEAAPQGLGVAEVAEWGAQVADALAAAHGAGVVHRDIKPANLMLLDSRRVKVCDFGIARAAAATASVTAQGFASLAYAAPEQLSNETVDGRADLYSLGCTLYHLLTGSPPFTGDTHAAILAGHLSRSPAPPSLLRAEIPSALDDVVVELLAKSPAQRPDDASALADRLRTASLGQGPSTARTRRLVTEDVPYSQAAEPVYIGPMSWSATASIFRGRDYEVFTVEFPSGGSIDDGDVWGNRTYTDDSSIGLAAVHAGIITVQHGGSVTFEIRPGEGAYGSAISNGIESSSWGDWHGSFVFPENQVSGGAGPQVEGPVYVGPMSWSATASAFRGRDYEVFTVEFPSGGTIDDGDVWGNKTYTDDSSIGLAAVHAGIITLQGGGLVTFEIRPGKRFYGSAKRSGIESSRWGRWHGSFVFH